MTTPSSQTTSGPVDISTVFTNMSKEVSTLSEGLNGQITQALNGGKLNPIDMLTLQFNMGRFNAVIEATSSVTKGLTDTAKTLAQRAGG